MSGGFEDLGLSPELVRATQELDWLYVPNETTKLLFYFHQYAYSLTNSCRLPTDVQDEAIPYILGGGDVMVVRGG